MIKKKKIPAIQEMQQELWVRCLGQGDPLEKELATHSSILAWESHGQEPGGLQPMGRKELDTTEHMIYCHAHYIVC